MKKNSFSRKSLTFPGEKNFYLRRKINYLSEVLFKKGYPNRMVTIKVIIIIIIIITMIIMVV